MQDFKKLYAWQKSTPVRTISEDCLGVSRRTFS
jgi:hypothetical protein